MRQRRRVVHCLVSSIVATALGFVGLAACGGDDTASPGPDAGGVDAADDRSSSHHVVPDAGCEIFVDRYPVLPSPHVGRDIDIQYNSNPPSSGPHDEDWAAFHEFAAAVPRRNYVHDLEHGAVVFTYRCDLAVAAEDGGDAGECHGIPEFFRSMVNGLPDDPVCAHRTERVRTVISPDPLLEIPIAASAWGWTYRAQCLDRESLAAFVRDHYGSGPEVLCNDGVQQF